MGAFLDKPKTEKSSHIEKTDNLSYGLSAMQGWRIDMEDAHTAKLALPEPFLKWSYFGVYDGHAGSAVSAICSDRLLPTILETEEFKNLQLDSNNDPVDLDQVKIGIRKGFLTLDHAIGTSSNVESGEDKSGSTVCSVFLTPKYVIFANCGDSRGVLIRSNKIEFATVDHKPMNPLERERIQNAGGTVMIQRINGSLAVSRSLGDFDYKKVESKGPTEQLVSPEPEITVINRDGINDQLLVLACDGIWDVMTNEEIAEFVINRLQRNNDMGKVCEEVIDACLHKGSRDNMSVIIVTTPNAPKYDEKLGIKDKQLNENIVKKVKEYVNNDTNDMDLNSLLIWLQGLNLSDLPPGGLIAKRYLIDSLFEELSRDKQKPTNNSSESNQPMPSISNFQSVLALISGQNEISSIYSKRTNNTTANNTSANDDLIGLDSASNIAPIDIPAPNTTSNDIIENTTTTISNSNTVNTSSTTDDSNK